jgi:arabinogalactan oligomer / maltooligosaccharide transport system substrate-binding protein
MGEQLGVALLPSGPAGPAQPIVRAEGFVLREGVTEAPQNLALEFMRFATDVESQTLLMVEADKIPSNANVSTADDSFMTVFVEQAQSGFLLPNTPYWQPVAALGQIAYEQVLDKAHDPAIAVTDLAAAINRANGIVSVTPTSTPTPPESEREADLGEEDAPATRTPTAEATTEDAMPLETTTEGPKP